jgi:hypothetical protein
LLFVLFVFEESGEVKVILCLDGEALKETDIEALLEIMA